MEEKQLHKHIKPSCDTCEFYDWDDDMDDNVCIANLDEDEYRADDGKSERSVPVLQILRRI